MHRNSHFLNFIFCALAVLLLSGAVASAQELQVAPGSGYRSTSELPVAKSFDALKRRETRVRTRKKTPERSGAVAQQPGKHSAKQPARSPARKKKPSNAAGKPENQVAAKPRTAKTQPPARKATSRPPSPRTKPAIPASWQDEPERQIVDAVEDSAVIEVVDDLSTSGHREFDDSSRR